ASAEDAASLAALRFLDLDDLCAELGQDLGAGRAGLELRQVEDADPGEAIGCGGGFGHLCSSDWRYWRKITLYRKGRHGHAKDAMAPSPSRPWPILCVLCSKV